MSNEKTVNVNSQVVSESHISEFYEDESGNLNSIPENNSTAADKPFKVKAIHATSRISTQLNETWYSFQYDETREIIDDSQIANIRADLWNTVNGEVDNQVQYTIDSILGKVPVAPPPQQHQNMNPNQGPVIPAQYDY